MLTNHHTTPHYGHLSTQRLYIYDFSVLISRVLNIYIMYSCSYTYTHIYIYHTIATCYNSFGYLSWKQAEFENSFDSDQQIVISRYQVMCVASVDCNPVTAPVNGDILGQWPIADPPHVIVTLYKCPVQSLLLYEPTIRIQLVSMLQNIIDPCTYLFTSLPWVLTKFLSLLADRNDSNLWLVLQIQYHNHTVHNSEQFLTITIYICY